MLLKHATLTSLVKYLNENMTKKTHNEFTVSDVQAYIRRGHLPVYLGGNIISESKIGSGAKLYNLK